MKIAYYQGRQTSSSIKLGICGQHGGDPDSIKFCHEVGLTYVSCSPYRVPVARLAAAQAAIEEKLAGFQPAVPPPIHAPSPALDFFVSRIPPRYRPTSKPPASPPRLKTSLQPSHFPPIADALHPQPTPPTRTSPVWQFLR